MTKLSKQWGYIIKESQGQRFYSEAVHILHRSCTLLVQQVHGNSLLSNDFILKMVFYKFKLKKYAIPRDLRIQGSTDIWSSNLKALFLFLGHRVNHYGNPKPKLKLHDNCLVLLSEISLNSQGQCRMLIPL